MVIFYSFVKLPEGNTSTIIVELVLRSTMIAFCDVHEVNPASQTTRTDFPISSVCYIHELLQ